MSTWNPVANDVFLEALEFESAERRRTYLNEACGSNANLLAQVESLPQANDCADSSPEKPAPTIASTFEIPPLSERPGVLIAPYKRLEQIGEGGFGVVYMAEQAEPIRRRVALKLIEPGMDTKQVIARFEAEPRALALMDHPHIARVLDGGSTGSGRPYFVMALVKGIPITNNYGRNHLTARRRSELFVSVCQAVQHAHQKAIMHRDIKLSNVMVTLHDGEPVVKVIDFGAAKALNQRISKPYTCISFSTWGSRRKPLFLDSLRLTPEGQIKCCS
jgi:serine/threonine protein kinase